MKEFIAPLSRIVQWRIVLTCVLLPMGGVLAASECASALSTHRGVPSRPHAFLPHNQRPLVQVMTESENWRVHSRLRPIYRDGVSLGPKSSWYIFGAGAKKGKYPSFYNTQGEIAPVFVTGEQLESEKDRSLDELYRRYALQEEHIRQEIPLYIEQDKQEKGLHLIQMLRFESGPFPYCRELHGHGRVLSSSHPEDKLLVQKSHRLPLVRKPGEIWVEWGRTFMAKPEDHTETFRKNLIAQDWEDMNNDFYWMQFSMIESYFSPDYLIVQVSGLVLRGFLWKFPWLKDRLQLWRLQRNGDAELISRYDMFAAKEDYAIVLKRDDFESTVDRLAVKKIMRQFLKARAAMGEPGAFFDFTLTDVEQRVFERTGLKLLLEVFYRDHPSLVAAQEFNQKNWSFKLSRGEFGVWLFALSTLVEAQKWAEDFGREFPSPKEVQEMFP